MSRYSKVETMYSNILDDDIAGFYDRDDMPSIGNKITITASLAYRPDKIAYLYLGDSKLDYLIYYANNFTNGIEDFYPGRTIYSPNLS